MAIIFRDFDLRDFWDDSDYARKNYVGPPLTDALVESVERELGYTLPGAYRELARAQNGGMPRNTCSRTSEPTSWAPDHVAISGILAIGRDNTYSLCGELGSAFHIAEWGYPTIGVYFANCPSAGHDLLCLDYRACGPRGCPRVVHVDQDCDYKITFVAEDFEAFIRGLTGETEFNVD